MTARADNPAVPVALAYNVRQAAQALGVGETLVRSLVAQGRIPFARLGDRVVFPVSQLEVWLASEAAASVAPPTRATCGR